jgi:hypothetical protein
MSAAIESIPWPFLIASGVAWLAVCTAVGIVCGELLSRAFDPQESE